MDQTVNVTYSADVDGYMQSLAEVMTATERFGQIADNMAGRVAQVGVRMSRGLANLTLPKGMDMTPAVQTAAAYEQQLSLLAARAKASGDQFGRLGRDVRSLARDFPIGLGGAIQQFETLQRMGKKDGELAGLTQQMTKLGAATGELGPRVTESMGQLSRTFNQFNEKDVTKLSDSVTVLSSSFGSSASSMLDFSNAIAPLGKQLGMSATDVLGFSTAFSRVGEDGYRAANVFNKMLNDMERGVRTGSSEVKIYAEALGMTSEQFRSLASSDPTEAMVRFMEAVSTKGSEGVRILEDLGVGGAAAMKAITNVANSGDIREMISEATGAYGSGKTQEAAAEAFSGLSDSITKAGESMNQMVESSAKPLAEFLSQVADLVSKVMSGLAGIGGSEGVQTLLTVGMYGSLAATAVGKIWGFGSAANFGRQGAGMIGTAGRATGLNAIPQAFGRATGWIDAGGQQRLRMVGMAGGAMGLAGLATGNPLLGALGTAAMFMGPVRERINRAITTGGIGRNIASSGIGLMNMLSGGGAGTERVRDIIDGRTRGGVAYGMSNRLMDWASGLDRSQQLAYDRNVGWTPDQQRDAETRRRTARRAQVAAGQAPSLIGRQVANIAGQGFIGAGGALASAGSGLMSMIGGPAMLAMLGVAGGAYGYEELKAKREEWEEGESGLRKFADATGIAARGLEELSATIASMERSVSSTVEALQITSADINVATNKDYESNLNIKTEGRSAEAIANELYATFGNQSPAMLQRMKLDLIDQVGQGEAERILERFGTLREQGAMEPVSLVSSVASMESERASAFDRAARDMFNVYFGKDATVEAAKSAAENITTYRSDYRSAHGEQAGHERDLVLAADIARETGGVSDKDARLEMLMSTGLYSREEAEEVLKSASQSMGFDEGKWLRAVVSPWTLLSGNEQMSPEALEAAVKESEQYKELQEKVFAQEGNAKSTLRLQAEASGQRMLSLLGGDEGVIARAQAKNMTVEQYLAEDEGLRKTGGQPLMTDAERAAARAYTMEENFSAQGTKQIQNLFSAISGLGGGAGVGVEEIGNLMRTTKAGVEAGGELGPKEIANLNDAVEQFQAALSMQAPTMSIGAQRAARQAMAAEMTSTVTYDETGAPILSEQEDIARIEMQGLQMQKQLEAEVGGEQMQFIKQHRAQQIQIARQTDDFDRMRARALDDHQRATRYAMADHQRQVAYQEEDFNRSRGRAQADFDKQMARSNEDMNRQMLHQDEDYQRQRTYQIEDFERQMERAAKSIAKSMMSPMERIGAQRVWSSGGLAANMAEQNKAISDQLDTLEALKERGLSQEAIDILGLADSSNAMQTVSMAGMSEEDIAALNAAAAERVSLGGEIVEGGWNEDLRNQMEDFERQLARQEEQFEISRERIWESFNLSLARSNEDFQLSMDRSAEDFRISMDRSQESLDISLQRAEESLQLSLDRQKADFDRNIGRMQEDLLRMYEDLNLSEEERASVIEGILRGETVSYDEFISNRIATVTGSNTTIAEEGASDIAEATGDAQDDMAATTRESGDSVARTGREVATELGGVETDVKAVLGEVRITTSGTVGEMEKAATSAKDNILKVTETLLKEVEKQGEGVRDAIRDKMKDMSWLLEWDGATGTSSGSKKEVVIKIDEASFNKTWGQWGAATPGGQAGAGAGAGAGIAPAPTPVMHRYADTFDKSVGRTHLSTARHGTWAVRGYCLRNVSRIWESLGQRLNNAYNPSAVVHANKVRGAMRPGYMAPTGALYWWSVGRYGHVAVSDGKGNAMNNWGGSRVEKTRAASMSPRTYMGWTMPTALANGGIVRRPTPAVFGESGPEAVLPLDARGARFLSELVGRYQGNGGARAARTSGYTVNHSTSATTTVHDSSLHTGPVTVVSNDPHEMARRIAAERRRSRLSSRV